MKRPTQVSVEVAPDPDQVFQLWKKTLSKQHTAKVTVTEKAPDADQIVQLLEKEPARRPEIVRALIKSIERQVKARNSRRRAVGEHRNKSKRENAHRKKSIASDIAARLIQKEPSLGRRGKTSELARRVQAEWPRNEPPMPSHRHLRRWLTEK